MVYHAACEHINFTGCYKSGIYIGYIGVSVDAPM